VQTTTILPKDEQGIHQSVDTAHIGNRSDDPMQKEPQQHTGDSTGTLPGSLIHNQSPHTNLADRLTASTLQVDLQAEDNQHRQPHDCHATQQ